MNFRSCIELLPINVLYFVNILHLRQKIQFRKRILLKFQIQAKKTHRNINIINKGFIQSRKTYQI